MKFSLLVPSRGRPQYLKQLIDSLLNTTACLNCTEVLIMADTDDEATIQTVRNLVPNSKIPIMQFMRIRSDFLVRDYYNFMASHANGKYIWAIGDDVRFMTKNWDYTLSQKIEEYLKDKPDRIAYITTEDGTDAKHCCFPMITKEAIKAMGFFLHPEIMTWGADRTIWELYSAVNRVVNIPEIELNHISYHDGKAPVDDTARSVKERFFRDPECHNKVSYYLVPQQIKKLKGIIDARMEE